MIRSIGLDLVEIDRIRRDIEQYGERFVRKILGENELLTYEKRQDKPLFLAGRFAAKEAVIKALGVYLTDRPAFSSVEILNTSSGQPEVHLPAPIANQLGSARCHISITHERQFAAAVAIFSEE